MFSIFLDDPLHISRDVFILTVLLTVLALGSYSLWALIGKAITQVLDGKKAEFVQRYVFGGALLVIGIGLVGENLLFGVGH